MFILKIKKGSCSNILVFQISESGSFLIEPIFTIEMNYGRGTPILFSKEKIYKNGKKSKFLFIMAGNKSSILRMKKKRIIEANTYCEILSIQKIHEEVEKSCFSLKYKTMETDDIFVIKFSGFEEVPLSFYKGATVKANLRVYDKYKSILIANSQGFIKNIL